MLSEGHTQRHSGVITKETCILHAVRLCPCVGASDNKYTFVWPVCACVGEHQILHSQRISLSSCLTQVRHITGVTVVNNMCDGEVLYKKVW